MTPRAVIEGDVEAAADVSAFLERIASIDRGDLAIARGLFAADREIVVARAPGRLDVMGGIADYCGSLVLEMPIREATFAAVQRTDDGWVRVVSTDDDPNRDADVSFPFGAVARDDFDAVRERLGRDPRRAWSAYALGAFSALSRGGRLPLHGGARIFIDSAVPVAKGLSSSAALEVAVLLAVARGFGIEPDAESIAVFAQDVENYVVGAPCGIMDQITVTCGRAAELLALVCQPMRIEPAVAVPPEVVFAGIDSGIRHAVSGSDYRAVRIGAFMGYRILADRCGFDVERTGPGRVRVRDDRWNGYLANVDAVEFECDLAAALPTAIKGRDFLARYGGITDDATEVDPDRTYAVRVPAAHPIHENARVHRFRELLRAPMSEATLLDLGSLMHASHASYSACGLGSNGTDTLVDLAKAAGPARGLFGAKVTGGGSGGTVCVLARSDAIDDVARVAADYTSLGGRPAVMRHGSSLGAAAFGVLRLSPAT